MDRLPVRERDNRQQRRDDETDRDRVDEGADAGDDERGQDEVGRVGHRRERVGRQHRQSGDARQAFVVCEVRRNRLAEKEMLERKRGLAPRALTALAMSAKACFRVSPTGLADGLGLRSVLRLKADTPRLLGSPACCEWRST